MLHCGEEGDHGQQVRLENTFGWHDSKSKKKKEFLAMTDVSLSLQQVKLPNLVQNNSFERTQYKIQNSSWESSTVDKLLM